VQRRKSSSEISPYQVTLAINEGCAAAIGVERIVGSSLEQLNGHCLKHFTASSCNTIRSALKTSVTSC
jgi:hypothetical protein